MKITRKPYSVLQKDYTHNVFFCFDLMSFGHNSVVALK